jgi:hypothetical protein
MDAGGAFLVAWSGFAQPGGEGWDVYAQRYDAAGARQGSEFRVNATTAGDQQYPAVALDGAGNSVITWTTAGQDGAGTAVYARRFGAAGAAQGAEFRVNATTTGDQQYSRVSADATGNFVIAWASAGQDGSGRGIYAQRFSANGAKRGGEFQVNQVTAGEQFAPTVAGDDAGGFVVTWTGAQDGDMFGVFARAYDPAGAARGGEFRVNTHVPGNQVYSAATSSGDGKLVIVWESDGQDGSAFGVYGQRYAAPDTVAPTADVVNVSPDPRTEPVDTITVRFSEAVTGFGISDLRLTRDGLPANLLTAAQTLASADDVTFTLGNLAALTATPGSYTLTLVAANSGITDAAGNPLAGDASDAWTVAPPPARVVARHVFYNGSGFDGRDDSAGVADDDAIAPDKVELLPGAGRATFANYTSYIKGINGVMIDVEGLTAGAASGGAGVAAGAAAPGVADFTFRVGNSPDTAAWAVAPQIASVTVRSGAGVNGSDRVTLVWPDGAVRHQWLQVTVLATAATRLAAPDVFFFGNLPGETGDDADGAAVNAADVILTRAALEGGSASLSSRFDHDRNGRLDARDLAIARAAAGGKPLQFIGSVPAPAAVLESSARTEYRPPGASAFLSEADDAAGVAGADELVQ